MRVERTSGICSALPLPEYQAIGPRTHSQAFTQEDADTTSSRVFSDIAQEFDLRNMDAAEAFRLAERLMQEQLLTAEAHACLTGVPMDRVPGRGCQPRHPSQERDQRYDYISEFEGYVAFDSSMGNLAGATLLLFVYNVLCSLDALRRNGPLDLSV